MKTLKKVLSLVLVVAMIASMLIVGAAAAEETQYPEAAAVISGIKVMEGDERGMRYTDGVTREEAAAIICRLLLGDTSATLKTTTAPFADVAASRWSAGYIAYLKAQGIVSGVSATEFDPTAPVTGIAFAKMLLTAVGYGKAGEFEGAAWDINTITLANDKGLFADAKTADLTAGATREECMLYAFNTLLVPTVKYNKTFESYYVGESALAPVTGSAALAYSLAATKFNLSSVPTTDVFGRPAADYAIGVDTLATRVVTAAPAFVIENTVYNSSLYAKLGTALAAKITRIDHWVDGVLTTNAYAPTILNAVTNVLAPIAVAGGVTEAYIDGTVLTLVTTYEYISNIVAVNKAGVATMANGDKVLMPGAAASPYVYYVYTKSPIAAADDVVNACNITAIETATASVGTFVKTDAYGQYVIDTTAYVASKNATSTPATYGVQYYIYTDSLGNILMVAPVDTTVKSNDYLYLLDAVIAPATTGINGTPVVAKMEVVYATGGKAVVNYTMGVDLYGQPTVLLPDTTLPETITAATDAKLATGKWYSYVTAEDGSVTLVNAATNVVTGLGVTNSKFTVKGFGFKATSATVLNVVNGLGVVETYTGIANFPTVDEATYTVMADVDMYGNIVAINVYGTAASIAPAALPTVGYAAQYLYQDNYGFHYNFAIDGAMVEVIANTATLAGKAYIVTNSPYGYLVGAEVAADAAVYDLAEAKYVTNLISAVDAQYFTIMDADYTNVTSYYYNAYQMPTFVFDLAAGGAAGTLTAGRAVTVATYPAPNGACAQYIWLH